MPLASGKKAARHHQRRANDFSSQKAAARPEIDDPSSNEAEIFGLGETRSLAFCEPRVHATNRCFISLGRFLSATQEVGMFRIARKARERGSAAGEECATIPGKNPEEKTPGSLYFSEEFLFLPLYI